MTARLTSILAFRLVTREPDRLAAFYAGLGFAVGEVHAIPVAEMAMLGLQGNGWRQTFYFIHNWYWHLMEQSSCIRRYRFKITALRFFIQCPKCQR